MVSHERLTVTLDLRSGLWVVAGILAVSFGAALIRTTGRSLTVIGVGVLLAFAVEPLVLAVERRFGCSRGIGVGAVGSGFYRVVGTYFAGSLLVASIGGTYVLVVGLAVGVPLAPVAAVWYAMVSLIPQVGGFLGTSFVTLLALTQGVVPALIVLALVVAYMNTENYVITPAIVGQAVDLSPPVTMLAALVGAATAGVPGALAATPLCGTVKAVYLMARYDQVPDPPTPLRDRLPRPLRAVVARIRPPEEAPHGIG